MLPRFAVLAVLLAGFAGRHADGALPGIVYTMHSASVPSGGGAVAAAMEAHRADWTATVAWAGGRGRMDIVEGKAPAMLAKGDWVLFDSVDFIVVHPPTSSFFSVPKDLVSGADEHGTDLGNEHEHQQRESVARYAGCR